MFVYSTLNGCEDVYSNSATITVTPDIAISTQPVGGSICTGGNFNFNVTAAGSPDIHYQWESFNGSIWSNVGTDSPSYNTGVLAETTSYRVFVNADESGCEDVYSQVVIVTVTPDIAISAQPIGGEICEGGTWSLSALASGSPTILYQWQDSIVGGTWQNVSEIGGVTTGFVTDPLTVTTWYRLFIYANESGCEDIYSATVEVTVFDDIVISNPPVGGEICVGGTWPLSVLATGSPDIMYQWQDSIASGVWQNVSEAGGNTAGFTSDALAQTTWYRVFVSATENGCEDLYSASVEVTVYPDISISSLSNGGEICTDGVWTLSVSASGSPDIQYQWQDSTSTGMWQNVSEIGGTTAGFTSDPLSQTTWYRVFIYATENGCEDVYSSEVEVTVYPDIVINTQPAGGQICVGGTWTLDVIASGSPDILYQWQDSTAAGTWQNISETGGNTAGFTTDPLNVTTWYRVLVAATEVGCEDIYSTPVEVSVFPDIAISAQPVGGSICTGGNFDLSVVAAGSPAIQYQWQILNGGIWEDLAGANSPAFNTGVLTVTTQYRVFVSANQNGCEDIYSNIVSVVVTPDISISSPPVGGSICTGGNFTLLVEASGSPAIHYQWQAFLAGNWTIVGSDIPSYNTGALTATTTYRVLVYSDISGCEDIYSASIDVTVTPDIVISAQPVGGAICIGGDLTLAVTASGSPNIHYQWQAYNGEFWVVVGNDAPSYNTGTIASTTNYRVFVNANESGCEDVYSTEVSVEVYPDIAISGQPIGGAICVGGTWDLLVTASGSPAMQYQWQDSIVGGNWQNVSESLGNTPGFTTDPLSVTTWYRVFLSATQSGCEDIFSATVMVDVRDDISILTQPAGDSICAGGDVNLTVQATGAPGLLYQWESFNGTSWDQIPGATLAHV